MRAQLSCGASLLPNGLSQVAAGVRLVRADSDGGRLLLLSRGNLSGLNPLNDDGLYLITAERRQATAELLTRFEPGTVQGIAASDDLNWVVLRARLDITGENSDGSLELFLFNAEERSFSQLTDLVPGRAVFSVRISGDGNTLAFVSDANLTGENGDFSRELFLADPVTGSLTQLTDLSPASLVADVSVSGDGRLLAYHVRHTLSGFSELALHDRLAGTSQTVLTASQLEPIFLTSDGSALLLVTTADLLGKNADGSPELFRISLDSDGPSQFKQVSSFSSPIEFIAFSGDGRIAAARGGSQPVGPLGSTAYLLLETDSGEISLLPQAGGENDQLVLSEQGNRVYLVTSRSDGNFERVPRAFRMSCESSLVHYVPQMGNGRTGNLRFQTSLVFSNTGDHSSVQIEFLNMQGLPLDVELEGQGRGSVFNLSIPSGTPLLLNGVPGTELGVGYARVIAGPGVNGTAVFTGIRASSDTILYEAAVPLSESLTDFSLVVNTSQNFRTGLAMVNTATGEDDTAIIEMRLYDDRFNLRRTRELQLPPGYQAARFIDDIFSEVPGITEFVGMLTVSSSRPLAVITLRQNDDPRVDFPLKVPTLTTLRVAPGRADQ